MKSTTTIGKPVRGIIVTIPQMAQFLGCASKHVRELIEAGAPIYERGGQAGGKAHKLNSHEFMQWRDAWRDSQKLGRPPGPVDETKQRIQNAIAERKEFELAKAREGYIDLRDWSPFVKDKMVITREVFLRMTQRFRDQVPDAQPMETICEWMKADVTATLNAFAAGLHGVPDEAKETRG